MNDPAAGNVTRMSPAPASEVVETEGTVPAIVSELVWRQAQTDRAPATLGPRPDRPQHTRYALRGLLICARCGRRMQGHTVNRRGSSERVGYQCTYRNDYPGDDSHPKTLFVAEHQVLPALDEWLADLSSPERLDATVAAILDADNHRSSEDAELHLAAARPAKRERSSTSTSPRWTPAWTRFSSPNAPGPPRLSSLQPLPSSTPTRALNPIC